MMRKHMKDETKKKIAKWFWILVTVPFAILLLLLLFVWLFAKIPSFEELENPDSKLAMIGHMTLETFRSDIAKIMFCTCLRIHDRTIVLCS